MKYGCRAHDYGSFTAQELARTLADQGYNAAQLAMPKAIRGIADMNGISPEQLEEIRTAFAEADVEITVLSCYRDLSSPDDGTRTAAVADVQSMEIVLLDREIGQVLLDAEPDADALITKILNRAELEYEFCSAGDANPATMQIRKACAEYKPTDGFPHTFYKKVVSKVILYRDTHVEFKLQNGQIV